MDQNRQYIGNLGLDTSPLRLKQMGNSIDPRKYASAQSPVYRDEEDEYNRRRSEGLRKQMQINQYQLTQSKPLRQKSGSPENLRSIDRQTIPEIERYPPPNYFSLGPQIRDEGTFELPAHIKEHISNIQNDNQSLMRRLNLVIQELDRVNREKLEVIQKYQETSEEQADLVKLLNSEDNVDKVNKYMLDDLAYERDRNLKAKQQIKELEMYRNELIRELRKLQDQQEQSAKENKDYTYQLQQRSNKLQDIERDIYFTQEKLKTVNLTIEDSKKIGLEENTDKMELQRILGQLLAERNDLLSKIDQLQINYNECVREINENRGSMEAHNKQHSKLIITKVLFQAIENIAKNRLQTVFSEIQTYVAFDSKCHNKLGGLSQILDRAGKYKLRLAFKEWFSNALKPIQSKIQSQLLAISIENTNLRQKMFRIWRKQYLERIKIYDSKTKAVQKLWDMKFKEQNQEVKRSFQIWKEILEMLRLKRTKVKKFLWKIHFNKLNAAMNKWTNYNSNIDNQVRLNLLSKEFSQKQYLTILYNNLKLQITDSKRKRQNILFHCLKSWKDYLAYQKFLMGSNVAAMQLRTQLNNSLVKACFDSLKQNKETEKYLKTNKELFEEEIPKIQQLTNDNENFIIERQFKNKTKACESVKKMMSKQLYTYFMQWSQINQDYKEKLRTTLKDKIIQLYMETIRKAFNHWKVNHNDNKIQQSEMIINEMHSEQVDLTNEVLSLEKEVQQKKEQRDCCKNKSTLKCVESYQRRMKYLAIGRWRDAINELNVKQDGAETIIKRLKLRMLRKAFDFYVAGVNFKKQMIINEERCLMYKMTRDERLKRIIYDSWHLFRRNHTKAKEYWYRIFLRLENSMKQSAIKRWREVTQKQLEIEFQEEQHSIVEQIDTLNQQIGKLHIEETAQQAEISNQKNTMTAQAQRIIANAFARFYYTNETRGFEHWKEYVQFEKNKERLLKKYLDHMKKHQFYFVKSSFKNWILNANIQERKDQVKKEEQRLNDAQFQLEQQSKNYETTMLQLNTGKEEEQKLQVMYNQRMQKTVKMIIRKIDGNHYTGQKRYILQQWREYVKREVAFIKCIQNVITKSLWNKGFECIKLQSRSNRKENTKEIVLNRFRMKFWKATCGDAISIWRSRRFEMVTQTIQEVDEFTQKSIEDHQDKKQQIKNINMARAARVIGKYNLRNIVQSWRNVSKHLKVQRLQTEKFQSDFNFYWKRNALIKWQQRKQTTKMARLRLKKLKEKFYRIKLRLFFNGLKQQYSYTQQFCSRISNLANIHDLQGLKQSYNAIKSFAKSKEFVFQKRKANSLISIGQILEGILRRKRISYFGDLRIRCMNKRKIDKIKNFTIKYSVANQMRHFFEEWKKTASERSLAKEMNDEGPIREQVFEQRIIFNNLVELCQNEGYEDKEISDALNEEKKRQSLSLLKAVRKIQHYYGDEYLKPKIFDRWKQFIHMRRLFKHWLGFADKKSEFIKSDLHYAFDKWKSYHSNRKYELSRLAKKILDRRVIKNNTKLDNLAELVQDKENVLSNMNDQREALIDNYIRAQKVALSLWTQYQKQSLHQAFLRWSRAAKTITNQDTTNQLRQNLEFLEELKEKIKQFEHSNESLANENEELRQFSMDGYQIAKNVQQLTAEREKLSVDLADKSQMIRKLLDENERLTTKLRQAQEEAQSLIKSTMAGSSGFKTAKKGYF